MSAEHQQGKAIALGPQPPAGFGRLTPGNESRGATRRGICWKSQSAAINDFMANIAQPECFFGLGPFDHSTCSGSR